jgi:hypothetical protein
LDTGRRQSGWLAVLRAVVGPFSPDQSVVGALPLQCCLDFPGAVQCRPIGGVGLCIVVLTGHGMLPAHPQPKVHASDVRATRDSHVSPSRPPQAATLGYTPMSGKAGRGVSHNYGSQVPPCGPQMLSARFIAGRACTGQQILCAHVVYASCCNAYGIRE